MATPKANTINIGYMKVPPVWKNCTIFWIVSIMYSSSLELLLNAAF
jgi:hypothetical protein